MLGKSLKIGIWGPRGGGEFGLMKGFCPPLSFISHFDHVTCGILVP